MINITDKKDCCSCSACKSICPSKAIEMRADALGFLYPVVDKNKCTECGLCERVCEFSPNYNKSENLDSPLAYALRHKDPEQIKTSRSGAAFIAFSDYILAQGGIVYGVGYDENFRAIHKRATTKSERDEFKGSKYVQSDANGCFTQIKQDLKDGKKVLFSGTPCQVAGLKSYIGKNLRPNLYLMDIICHGVPGPFVWRDFLAYNQQKYNKKITGVEFRDKQKHSWASHVERLDFGDKHKFSTIYRNLFYSHLTLAHACGVCHFANTTRPSDVTLGDYWGYERTDPEFAKDNKGCSLIFCNTQKGEEWFSLIKDQVNFLPAKLENCLQTNLKRPSKINPQREKFEKDYCAKGFKFVKNKYTKTSLKTKIKEFLPRPLVKFIIKILGR
ncbi:MAG: Coenzyme F420 hydrogenase/dehydrogenase, beta subunit C-terminal domain [Rikenellaceae bacterium]